MKKTTRISFTAPDKMKVILIEFARRKNLSLSELLKLWLDDRIRVEAADFLKKHTENKEARRKLSDSKEWKSAKSLGEQIKSGKIKVEFAKQERVQKLSAQCDRILKAIGIKGAWLSDESTIGDFGLSPEGLRSASKKLGVSVSNKDYVWQLAERLQFDWIGTRDGAYDECMEKKSSNDSLIATVPSRSLIIISLYPAYTEKILAAVVAITGVPLAVRLHDDLDLVDLREDYDPKIFLKMLSRELGVKIEAPKSTLGVAVVALKTKLGWHVTKIDADVNGMTRAELKNEVMRLRSRLPKGNPTSGSWAEDAYGLLEMGASMIDANTVRGLLEEQSRVSINAPLVEQMLGRPIDWEKTGWTDAERGVKKEK